MGRRDKAPIWVSLAFANVGSRKGALILVWCNVLCCLYCFPWTRFFSEPAWLGKVFFIKSWIWLALMVAITFWYWISFRWADRNEFWSETAEEEQV